MDYQREVIVGSTSNEGCKIAMRDIVCTVVVEAVPLRREAGERVTLKNLGLTVDAAATGLDTIGGTAGAVVDSSGSMAKGWTAVD